MELERQSIRNGVSHRALNHYAICRCFLLEPLCQNDTGTGNGAVGNNNFTHTDTDSNLRQNFVTEFRVALNVGCLKCQCRRYRIRSAAELGHQCIAPDLMGNTTMPVDCFGKYPKRGLNALMGERFI